MVLMRIVRQRQIKSCRQISKERAPFSWLPMIPSRALSPASPATRRSSNSRLALPPMSRALRIKSFAASLLQRSGENARQASQGAVLIQAWASVT
jgi:hypothetical protein